MWCVFSLSSASAQPVDRDPSQKNQIKFAVSEIVLEAPSKPRVIGNGFFVNHNTFVTNFDTTAHLFPEGLSKDSREMSYIARPSGRYRLKRFKHISILHDMVMIEIEKNINTTQLDFSPPGTENKQAYIAYLAPDKFDRNRQISLPGGFKFFPVEKVKGRLNPSEYISTGYGSLVGAAGSPLLNSNNRVIGIVGLSGFIDRFKHNNWFVVEPFEKLTAEYNSSFDVNSRADTIEKALDKLYELVNLSDARAMHRLGELFYFGQLNYPARGITKNMEKAFEWFQKASLSGRADSQFMAWVVFKSAKDMLSDKKQDSSFKYLKKSAEQNYIPAIIGLARHYLRQNNYEAAEYQLEKPAVQNLVNVKYLLGRIYIESMIIHKQIEGLNLIKTAAGLNYMPAQEWLFKNHHKFRKFVPCASAF